MKVVVFGTGLYYQNRRDRVFRMCDVVAFVDNDPQKQGGVIDGRKVFAPESLTSDDIIYDRVLLMSADAHAMREQLNGFGLKNDTIVSFEELMRGVFVVYQAEQSPGYEKKCLIITDAMDYNGGSRAIVYLSMSLIELEYNVSIVTTSCRQKMLEEVRTLGVTVYIQESLNVAEKWEMQWTTVFDDIIVNTFQMNRCFRLLPGNKRIFWWLHESKASYESAINAMYDPFSIKMIEKRVLAVSEVARRNYYAYSGMGNDEDVTVMTFGIPDRGIRSYSVTKNEKEFVFLLVANVHYIKGHDVMLDALDIMDKSLGRKVRCLFAGYVGNDVYANEIRERVKHYSNVTMCGLVDSNEMVSLYMKANAVVVPSRQDCLPTVAMEGMMYGKVCIVSDAAGITEYMRDGENGMIFNSEDASGLADCMEWIVSHREQAVEMGKKARITYCREFSMESFTERLRIILD